jgi:hypothetical protein
MRYVSRHSNTWRNILLVDQISDVQWVIVNILGSHLTSFDAWPLDRHREELMFQSGSWGTSPTFADEQAVSLSLRAGKVRRAPIISSLQIKIGHIRYQPIKGDDRVSSHSRVN